MMKHLYLGWMCLLVSLGGALAAPAEVKPAHDAKLALYELYREAGSYTLHVQFDREAILNTLMAECPGLPNVEDCLTRYVARNLQLTLDEQQASLSLDKLEYVDDHVQVVFTLSDNLPAEPGHVAVEIHTLLHLEEQYNIFRVMFGPRVRSFQLNQARVKTQFDL